MSFALRAWIAWTFIGAVGVAIYTWRIFTGYYGADLPTEYRTLWKQRPAAVLATAISAGLLGCLLGPVRLGIDLAARGPE